MISLKNLNYSFLFIAAILFSSCQEKQVDDAYNLIPLPNQIQYNNGEFEIDNQTIIAASSEALKEAEYLQLLIQSKLGLTLEIAEQSRGMAGSNSIFLDLVKGNALNEAYALLVDENQIRITSDGNPGIFYGIQTLVQIIDQLENKDTSIQSLLLEDHPKFGHRGLLLDCCRHFMSLDFIKKTIDLLAYYKMNTLHWHLTEDQGWRIEIESYPLLTEIGAWRIEDDGTKYGGFYSKVEIREIVAYASARHITIIPEIELPGHSSAAISAYPWLSCTGEQIEVETEWGVFQDIYCAGNDSVFSFLEQVLDEVVELFPGVYVHIGGDEAPKSRWEECSKCQKRITDEELHDEHGLQSYFINRVGKYLESKGKRIIGWDEILEGGIPSGAVVQSWRGFQGGIDASEEGHEVIMSPTSHCYLDYSLEAIDLEKVYSFDPIPASLSPENAALILGAEVNMWSERVTEENVNQKIYPRLLAMAEVLWSYPQERDYPNFLSRVREHYSILETMGIDFGLESVPVEINSELQGDSLTVILTPGTEDLQLFYSVDSGLNWIEYQAPVLVEEELLILAKANWNGNPYGEPLEALLVPHLGLNKEFSITTTYSPNYTGGGADGLLNGRLGSSRFRDGNWQGRQGVDLEIEVDLGAIQLIDEISSNFFQYANAWIFIPKKVVYSFSSDGVDWTDQLIISPVNSPENKEVFIEGFSLHSLNKSCRYVKMKAVNFGVNPPWHDAPGMESWLFCDELIIR